VNFAGKRPKPRPGERVNSRGPSVYLKASTRPGLSKYTFTPILADSSNSSMGRPADGNATADESQSLTVRDNRTGKTYNIPYVRLAIGTLRL
jgi:hypothetical protein